MVANLFEVGFELGILFEVAPGNRVTSCAMSCLLMASCAALYMVLVVLLDVACLSLSMLMSDELV